MTAPLATSGENSVCNRLRTLMQDLDRGRAENRQQIRDLLEAGAEEFYGAAIEVLKEPAGSPSLRFLVLLLITNGFLLRCLSDPALSREQALELARCALQVDAMADVTLAREFADGIGRCQDPAQIALAGRLLEILDEVSNGTRIFSSLMRLVRHPNSYLRSKAVLMIGRGNRNVKWVRERLSDSDPRIRANAVESLWGLDTEEARELLQSVLRDPDNRVSGNATLGLYLLGDGSVISELWRRSRDPSPMFRATCAWVMGEAGDPRFAEVLAGMLQDPAGTVRKRAVSAMGKLKAAACRLAQAPPFLLAGRFIDSGETGTGRRFKLAIAPPYRAMAPRLLTTHFVLTDGGRPVTSYKVTEKMPPEVMSVAFLLPRGTGTPGLSWSSTALECLHWKRLGDTWGCVSYLPSGVSGIASTPGENPSFLVAPEAISTSFRRRPGGAECMDVWRSLRSALGSAPRAGRRHVIVYSGSRVAGEATGDLVAAATASRALVQVISLCPNPALEDFCQKVQGVFQCVKADDFSAHAAHAYLNLLAQYEISYIPVEPEGNQICVRVRHPQAAGETMVAVVRRPVAGSDAAETHDAW